MRSIVQLSAIAALSVMSIALFAEEAVVAQATPRSLADAAESFAEEVLGLPAGSASAQSMDRRVLLGECHSGWAWGFAFSSRQTVQVVCPGNPRSRRLVSLAYAPSDDVVGKRATDNRLRGTMVVATRDLPFGHQLTSSDLVEEPLAAGARASATLSSADDVSGHMLTRSVRRGEALGRADLRAAVVIKRNSIIMGWAQFTGGKASAKLVALENGKSGQWIDLENPQSGRRLRGEVQSDGSVRLGSQGSPSSPSASDSAKESRPRVD